jgi:hypothetical protein
MKLVERVHADERFHQARTVMSVTCLFWIIQERESTIRTVP